MFEEINEDLTILVLQNNVILSKVLSFLPFKDLKNARQVNQIWMAESQKFFKSRSLFKIDFAKAVRMHRLGQKFADFIELSKFHVNFKITQSFIYEDGSFDEDKEFKQSIKQFCKVRASTIRSLTLETSREKITDFKFIAYVLKRAPQLEELNLCIDLQPGCIPLKYDPWHVISATVEEMMNDFLALEPLTLLKKFKIELPSWKIKKEYRQKLGEIFRKFLQLTPNIQVLDLQHPHYFSFFDSSEEFIKIYLKELIEMKMEWKSESIKGPFNNLTSIKLPVENIEQLLELKQQIIRKLTISASSLNLKRTLLPELLAKHAKTLESFEFVYTVYSVPLGLEIQKIDFPNLPKLESLEFYVTKYPRNADARSIGAFNLKKLFLIGGFKEKFPLLKSFTWKMSGEVFDPRTYERIFPRPNQDTDLCFPQLTSLNLSGPPSPSDVNCNEKEYKEWMIWLAKMFPNVYNQEFSKARLQTRYF